jgi:hypothetical protein
MNRLSLLLILATSLSACADARLGAGIGIGPDGVKVRPVLATRVGGATVAISR